MDDPRRPALQLARLQAELDAMERSHAAEIRRLREEMAKLGDRLESPAGDSPGTKTAPSFAPPAAEPGPQPVPVVRPSEPSAPRPEPATGPMSPPGKRMIPTPPPFPSTVPAPAPAAMETAPPPPPEPASSEGSMELNFGRVWLVRIGIVLLVTGLVLLGNYAYRNWIRDLPAVVRLGFLVLTSLGICGAGAWCTRRDKLRAFGEVVLAGGMGFFYWCAFAAHHVARLRVIESPVLSTIVLVLAAASIVAVSLRRGTRTTAVMGLLLASYSMVLQPMGLVSAVSNLLLAGTGVWLLRRKNWAGPGAVAMAGAYGAYFWWNLAGAAGGSVVPAALGFLVGNWVIFALPGVLRPRDPSTDAYRAAWFDGANNLAFFGSFSLTWWSLGYGEFWRVPANFGFVLAVLGAIGRGRSVSADTHLTQGLVALTAAMVLKLEGYHLAFGLALESLVMAGAFVRFRRLPELVFAVLSGIGAMGWVLARPDLPVWSTGGVALLLAGATVLLRIGADRGGRWSGEARQVVPWAMAMAGSVALSGWCLRLPEEVRGIVAAGLSLGVVATALRIDRRGWMPELRVLALVFALVVPALLFHDGFRLGIVGAAGVAAMIAAATGLWERRGVRAGVDEASWENRIVPVGAWIQALTVPLALWIFVWELRLESWSRLLLLSVGVAGLAVLTGRLLRCPTLRFALELLFLGALGELLNPIHDGVLAFLPFLAALGARFGAACAKGDPADEAMHAGLTRVIAAAGWIAAWCRVLPDHWTEVMALSALGVVLARPFFRPGRRLDESLVFGVLALLGFVAAMARVPWEGRGGIPDGWGLVLASSVAALLPARDSETGRRLTTGLTWLATAALGLWSTRWLVGGFGWQAAAILWSVLGFGLVSFGLWRARAAFRHAGFVVLALALGKLFVVDVWDFSTFFRVAAFLALGVALVVLGFFYNRFADLFKRLVETEKPAGPRPG